ncbi:DUF4179 domain-containing protein [Metabacillus iocasae]|uniref:DUF4179 domain-containing protein n=1 Tax=Priestia iocasae TaxID=2291674 RepID=A0ABS2QTK8_9BACI|nr:DUF4179 domain-containing protein [Metabacillus iocasae]MBM7702805.1 hypothetical protein [Metabacillus iocasae]
MDKQEFNQSMDEMVFPEQKLKERESIAMLQAKKKKRSVKRWVSSTVAAGLLLTSMLGAGFLSPALAQTLTKVPVIGSIYLELYDIAGKEIEQKQLANSIEEEDTKNGITMKVKEAVYDGNRLVVTVEYTGSDGLLIGEKGEIHQGLRYITINGNEPELAIGGASSDSVDEHTVIESHQYTMEQLDQFGDKIDIAVRGENIFGQKGTWEVAFPLEKRSDQRVVVQPNERVETKDKQYAMTVKQIAFMTLGTRIDLGIDYPTEQDKNDTWPMFRYEVIDDKGNVYRDLKLQVGATGENGREIMLLLPPFKDVPKSFTIQPYDDHDGTTHWENHPITELQTNVTLP